MKKISFIFLGFSCWIILGLFACSGGGKSASNDIELLGITPNLDVYYFGDEILAYTKKDCSDCQVYFGENQDNALKGTLIDYVEVSPPPTLVKALNKKVDDNDECYDEGQGWEPNCDPNDYIDAPPTPETPKNYFIPMVQIPTLTCSKENTYAQGCKVNIWVENADGQKSKKIAIYVAEPPIPECLENEIWDADLEECINPYINDYECTSDADCAEGEECKDLVCKQKSAPKDNKGDTDGDGIPDDQDNCPNMSNPNQQDKDYDNIGDVCDDKFNDIDQDGIADEADNCPNTFNPDQSDLDHDFVGDVCDSTSGTKDPNSCSDDLECSTNYCYIGFLSYTTNPGTCQEPGYKWEEKIKTVALADALIVKKCDITPTELDTLSKSACTKNYNVTPEQIKNECVLHYKDIYKKYCPNIFD